jgi:hypothetical protein
MIAIKILIPLVLITFSSTIFANQIENSNQENDNLIYFITNKKSDLKTDNKKGNLNTKNFKKSQNQIKINFNLSFGQASGNNFENVYNENKKLSELKWKFNDIPVASFSSNINFHEYFILNLSYLTSKINSYHSSMTDYDWRGESGGDDGNTNHANWTDYSYSKVKTNLQQFDINTQAKLFKGLYFKIGYRQNEFDFSDQLQNYSYSCLNNDYNLSGCRIGLRNINGNLNNVNAINYHQTFKIPYIGLNLITKFFNNKLSTEIFGSFSNQVSAEDQDHHILRSLKIKRTFNNGKFYNLGFNINYKILDNLSTSIGYDYQEIPEIKGNSVYNFYDKNEIYYYKNNAGISSKTQKIMIGINYEFNL